ncbi:uncharacterized protein LOC131958181 [Physella acuta]|uniref:uncharacterized protein LOC131958181 n=1 Tax=Physella acuta TaxID=109671 RepID=UPI0027DC1AAE|nr:uncharacterized protein LOC131958181 [Physella acuta]XP_059179036.1 uncharacterized protein LOC131958181 [Physella acuta]
MDTAERMSLLVIVCLATVCCVLSKTICDVDVCSRVECLPVLESDCQGMFIKKGGFCRCCDACFNVLKPGDTCQMYDMAAPPTALCPNGYYCDSFHMECSILLG